MATEVAALVARLEADVRDFERGMRRAEKRMDGFEKEARQVNAQTKKAKRGMTDLAKTAKVMGAAIAGAFVVREIVRFGAESVRAATDLNESINAVEVTFGDAADGVKALGEQAADSMGISNAAFNAAAVSFSAFVDQIVGPGGDVVGTMQALTQRAADFASVMNLDVAEAMTIFRSGLAGETESVRRFGVDLSAVTVAQKAMALGLAETTSALTEQDKILARYHLLMEQTEKTAGDFANTSDDLANATRRLQAKFEDAKATVGESLIPVLEDLIPVGEEVISWIAEAGSEFGNLVGSISEAEAAINQFRIEVGQSPEDLRGLVTVAINLKDRLGVVDDAIKGTKAEMAAAGEAAHAYAKELQTVVKAVDLSFEQFTRLKTGEFDDVLFDLGFDRAEIELLIDLLENKFAKALSESNRASLIAKHTSEDLTASFADLGAHAEVARQQFRNMGGPLGGIAEQMRDFGKDTQSAADAINQLAEETDSIVSPALDAIDAYEDWQDALQDLEDTQKDVEATQDDVGQATRNVLRTYQDLIAAAGQYAAQEGVDIEQAIANLGRQAGLTDDEIRSIIDDMRVIDGMTATIEIIAKFPDVEQARAEFARAMGIVEVPWLFSPKPESNVPSPPPVNVPPPTNISQFDRGGMVPGPLGRPQMAVVHGGEQVLTPAQQNSMTINQTFERVEGDNIAEDIQLANILSGVGQWAETVR